MSEPAFDFMKIWTQIDEDSVFRMKGYCLTAWIRWSTTVANRPDLAADPKVVNPIRGGNKGHLDQGHGGNYQNPKK